ncbi:MAG: carboxymuconolactone decarboxylase family protein [Dehalococcoidia bacterium]
MANVEPLARADIPEFEPIFTGVERFMGFVPNSMFTMARRPEVLRGFQALGGAVLGTGTVSPALKQLVALMASTSAGCRYCQAHTSGNAVRAGTPEAKLEAVYAFETDPQFSEAERAALRLARDAGLVPNATTPGHFVALRPYFDDAQIVEIVAVISFFGFLNRWNDTMATTLEDEPVAFASQHLAPAGWEPGKHA